MNRYGQNITWSTINAPQVFTGTCTSYSYRDNIQRQLDEDMGGDNRVLIQHSRKASISFEARVTEDSLDFLDLSVGGALTIDGISTGTILATRAVERWALGRPKTASVQATHFPDLTQSSPTLAGKTLSAFTPSQSLAFLQPGGKLIYGTSGITHGSGIVHGLVLTQELQITEDEPSPAGTILGAATHGYLRTIQLDLLATASNPIPSAGDQLTFTAAPANCASYRVESAEVKFQEKRGKMYSITAVWIPALSA
jgi:hypothetical protein